MHQRLAAVNINLFTIWIAFCNNHDFAKNRIPWNTQFFLKVIFFLKKFSRMSWTLIFKVITVIAESYSNMREITTKRKWKSGVTKIHKKKSERPINNVSFTLRTACQLKHFSKGTSWLVSISLLLLLVRC